MPRLILVNPYSGGSHALWEQGLARHLPEVPASEPWTVEVIRLPGRHWKWRMHAAAWTLVQRMIEGGMLTQEVDVFLVTDMLDVAQFRAALPPSHRTVPIALYFHENQLTFPEHPERPPMEWDRHYAFGNLMSALMADAVWFNSAYHRSVFLEAIPDFLKQLPSPRPVQPALRIDQKSQVLPIGLEDDVFAGPDRNRFGSGAPVIAWNHRWEHDKGPRAFLELLRQIKSKGISFRLAMLGQEFEGRPEAFDGIQREFDFEVVHWGYAESRREYLELLASSQVALVTAHHDFFGISVLESAALGLDIVAPSEVAYPDHFPGTWLCERHDMLPALEQALRSHSGRDWRGCAERYRWDEVAKQWGRALRPLVGASIS